MRNRRRRRVNWLRPTQDNRAEPSLWPSSFCRSGSCFLGEIQFGEGRHEPCKAALKILNRRRIDEKKPSPQEAAFTALVEIGEQGRMLMRGMSVQSCSPLVKGGGCPALLRELPLNWCLLMSRMCFDMFCNSRL